jgi:predicted nucleotidyltransferase
MSFPDSASIVASLRQQLVAENPEQAWIIDNAMFLHIGGSRLYGIAKGDSDIDIRGITLAPQSYWVGARRFEQKELAVPDLKVEAVIYDVRKWLSLVRSVNPNVVESLFVPDDSEFCLRATDAWRHVHPQALALLNQSAYASFTGYTTAQLRKMLVKFSNKTGRQAIAEKYGFDLKFAAHAFRLAAQGAELLRTGQITLPRPEREHLRAIRHGQVYSPDQMDECVADLTAAIAALQSALDQSVLPASADFARYDRLLIDIYDRYVAPSRSITVSD